jgi:transposase InsO family protein
VPVNIPEVGDEGMTDCQQNSIPGGDVSIDCLILATNEPERIVAGNDRPRPVPAPRKRKTEAERDVTSSHSSSPRHETDESGATASSGETIDPGNEEQITVCHLRSASQYVLQVEVAGQKANAVIDCGAEVTLISENLYQSLADKPPKLRDVKLYAVGKQALMSYTVGPVEIKIGSKLYQERVYVVPMQFDMLLGVDILKREDTVLHMGEDTLTFDGQMLKLNVDRQPQTSSPVIGRVTVARRRVVPPNSVTHISCKLDEDLPSYIIEPSGGLSVLVPRTVHSAGTDPVVCVVNATDKYMLLKKGKEIATAHPVGTVIEEDAADGAFCANVMEGEEVEEDSLEVPQHLQAMFDASVTHLDLQQKLNLAAILRQFEDVFASSEFDLGNFSEIEHAIDTGDAKPIKQRMRRTPACFEPEEEAHLKKMLDAGVIRESMSEWASPPVLIRKRDGTVRWCIDYRALNNVTVKDVFPLPLVGDCLDTLAGNVWFSKLDANSAYWQIKIKDEDCKKTAFLTKYGLFEHVKMGFGLYNAPATFSRVMNLVLQGWSWKTVLAFLDDILVLGITFDDHMRNLIVVLKRLRQFGLKLKPKKCMFFQQEVEFLGRDVTGNSLAMAEQDTKVVRDWPTPTCSKDVERFMGLVNYHRGFVKDFAQIGDPLYRVIGKNKFRWDEEQQQAFESLKHALTKPPVLALPNRQDSFILDTDASDIAIGAELIQVQDKEEKVVAYASYAMTQEQRRYCVTRKELLAVVRFTRQFRHYLLGREFLLRTDHSSLTWLLRFKEPQGQLARWMEELSQYTIVIKYRAGRIHGNADALSRIPEGKVCRAYRVGVRPCDLPCGGCDYCTRADKQWGSFTTDVDEAVPLATGRFDEVEDGQCRCICTSLADEPDEVQEIASDGRIQEGLLRFECGCIKGDTGSMSQELLTVTSDGRKELLRVACVGPTSGDGQVSRSLHGDACNGQQEGQTECHSGDSHVKDDNFLLSPTNEEDDVGGNNQDAKGSSMGTDMGFDDNHVNVGGVQAADGSSRETEKTTEIEFELLPWEYDGLTEGGRGVSHLDIAVEDGDLVILSIGVSRDEPTVAQSACWGYSMEDLQEAQAEDVDLQMLLAWLKDGTEPTQGALFRTSPAAKFYWINKALFELIEEIIFKKRTNTLDMDLVMPISLRKSALESCHDLPSSGHQGIARTKATVKEKFFWHGMVQSITNYVTSCDVCNKNKKRNRYGRCPLTEYQAGAPMERVHIDFMGPLPRTPRGNEHILVMVDQFTKWVECVPLPSQTAEVTAKAAVDTFFSRFGYPFQLFSDQGRNFESKLMAALCEALHIHKTRTTPYRPSANGQVERYNRTLMDAVRCFIGKSQNQWDLHLQQITGAIRASVNRSTGYTANKLMLGFEVNTPAHIMFPQVTDRTQDLDDFVCGKTANIQEAHETARRVMKTTSRRMKRDYDLRILERPYKEGDTVYLLDTAAIKGKCKKLRSPWKGPGVIDKKLSPYLYRIKLQNAVLVTNHDRMKPCHDRKLPAWIARWRADPVANCGPSNEDPTAYCTCRQPCNGRFMIQCDFCDEWYHGSCVNVTASEALNIDRYKCGVCREKFRGRRGQRAQQ